MRITSAKDVQTPLQRGAASYVKPASPHYISCWYYKASLTFTKCWESLRGKMILDSKAALFISVRIKAAC